MKLFAVTYEYPRLSMETLHSIVAADSVAKLTAWVSAAPEIVESAVVATCLRLEVYGVMSHPELALDALDSILGERHGRLLLQQDAVAHLCRVTAGLESIVWGETMVTSQVRRAYRSSVDRSLCGPNLHRLFHAALRERSNLRGPRWARSRCDEPRSNSPPTTGSSFAERESWAESPRATWSRAVSESACMAHD